MSRTRRSGAPRAQPAAGAGVARAPSRARRAGREQDPAPRRRGRGRPAEHAGGGAARRARARRRPPRRPGPRARAAAPATGPPVTPPVGGSGSRRAVRAARPARRPSAAGGVLGLPPLLTVGVDIGGTKVVAGVVDAGRRRCSRRSGPRRPDRSQSPDVVEGVIADVVTELVGRHDVHAVGIGAAGFVDAARESVLFAPHLSWRHEPLTEKLSARLRLPVVVDNDANAAAWAEWRFGAGRGETHLAMVTLGTGIGGALLFDGALVRGRFGVAGEFGHMQVVPGGPPLRVRQPRLLGAVRERQRARARGARAHRLARSPGGARAARGGRRRPGRLTGPMVTQAAQDGRPDGGRAARRGRRLAGRGPGQPRRGARPRPVRHRGRRERRRVTCSSTRRGPRSAAR